ncbi:MAG TPA: caspase family protein [Anaerolineales bacterium]|jgi:caspase domain-containing protein|nr:caspase family protein [Anaerolineales bacterium]
MANPHYTFDHGLIDGVRDRTKAISSQTIFIVTGSDRTAEVLDHPVAKRLREEIDKRGNISSCRRALIVSDAFWLNDATLHTQPVIAVGGPTSNALTRMLVDQGDRWHTKEDCHGSFIEGPPPRVTLWGRGAVEVRPYIEEWMRIPNGLSALLKLCWGSRRALLIGNAAYSSSPLSNSVNDATDLATVLRLLGFDVRLHRDANKPMMESAIDLFTQRQPLGMAGLFFFSGHGVQIDGINYLVPIGARFSTSSDVKYHAVAADWVLARMDESGMDVKLLFLDACRALPLGWSRTRTLSRGLAGMDTPKGALIAYATSPGKTASDGFGRNSPFTTHLLRELIIKGRDIEVALKAVWAGVQQATGGKQIPWVASSMTGNFYTAR